MTPTISLEKQRDIKNLIFNNMKAITSVLPKNASPERAARMAYNTIIHNPKLALCTPDSLADAIIKASSLGLEIGDPLGTTHVVAEDNKAKLIIDYKGFIKLAYRSNRIESFSFHPVYAKDKFEYTYGTNSGINHTPCDDDNPGELIYAYAIVKFKGGGHDFEVVNKRIVSEVKNRTTHPESSPWNNGDEWIMWCKTAVRRIIKRLPLSPEIKLAETLNEQDPSDNGTADVIDVDFESKRVKSNPNKN